MRNSRTLPRTFPSFGRWADGTLLLLLAVVAMHGWWNRELPLTPRREMLVQMSTAWLVRQDLLHGVLFSSWTPAWFGGLPWTRFLAWPVYYAVAGFSALSGLSLGFVTKLFYLVVLSGSAIGLYLWASSLAMGRAGALIAGAVYLLFPFHLHTAVDWWEHALFWALLPLPLWWYERHRQRPAESWWWVFGLGFFLGILPLANLERTPPAWVVLGIYIGLREAALWRSGQRTIVRSLQIGLAAAVIAGALGAAVLVPAAVEMKQVAVSQMRGVTATLSADFLRGYAVSVPMLWDAALKRAKMPVDTSALPIIWKAFGGLNAWYLGGSTLLLSLIGSLSWRRFRGLYAVWVMVVIGLVMAAGTHLPFNPVMHTPFLSRLMPFRALMFVAAGLAVLAGAGAASLLGRLRKPLWQAAIFVAILGLIVVDYKPAWAVFQHTPAYFSADELAAYRWLDEHGQGYRLWEPTGLIGNKYRYTFSVRYAAVPHYDGHWDEGVPLPMSLLRERGDETTLLNLLGVRYVLLRPADPHFAGDNERLQAAGWDQQAWQSHDVIILENEKVQPFAQLYAQAVRMGSDDTAALPDALSRHVALLDGGLPANESVPATGTLQDFSPETNVRDLPLPAWQRPRGDEIDLHVETPRLALLALSEAWYPLWRATVNGADAPVLRVDGAFLGVVVPAGASNIRFHFARPAYVWFGYLLSISAACGTLAVFLYAWRRGKMS